MGETDNGERIRAVEESAKQAHKRIDRHIQRHGGDHRGDPVRRQPLHGHSDSHRQPGTHGHPDGNHCHPAVAGAADPDF